MTEPTEDEPVTMAGFGCGAPYAARSSTRDLDRSFVARREEVVVRCFFMKHGHITAVGLLPGPNDDEAVKKSHELFAARKSEAGHEGFEAWEQARMIIQYPLGIGAEAEALPPSS